MMGDEMDKKSCFLIIIGLLVWNIGLSQNSYPSSGNAIINELRIGKYGGTLSGDPDPYNIYTPGNSGNHDLILFGSSSATLNLRLYDGDFKIGTSPSPTTIRNDGSAFFGGKVGIGTSNPSELLHINNGRIKFSGVPSGSWGASGGVVIGRHSNGSLLLLGGTTGISLYPNPDGADAKSTYFDPTGMVGIGTRNPTERLTVNGTAKAEEVIVVENVGADFVFEENYDLPELGEVESHIKQHKRLPEIPSAEEMIEHGVKVGDLQMKLLQKIEELTLYTIKQQTLLEQQQKNIEVLKRELQQLKGEK